MSRQLHLVLVFLLALFTAGCGDSATDSGDSVFGTYQLQTVNGQAPPIETFRLDDEYVEFTGAILVLHPDRSYDLIFQARKTTPQQVFPFEDRTNGTYLLTGSDLRFTETESDYKFAGTVGRRSVDLTYNRELYHFTR